MLPASEARRIAEDACDALIKKECDEINNKIYEQCKLGYMSYIYEGGILPEVKKELERHGYEILFHVSFIDEQPCVTIRW